MKYIDKHPLWDCIIQCKGEIYLSISYFYAVILIAKTKVVSNDGFGINVLSSCCTVAKNVPSSETVGYNNRLDRLLQLFHEWMESLILSLWL